MEKACYSSAGFNFPDLDDPGKVIRTVQLHVLNVVTGKHALYFTGSYDAFSAGSVLVVELSINDIGVDFQIAVRMPAKAVLWRNLGHMGCEHAA